MSRRAGQAVSDETEDGFLLDSISRIVDVHSIEEKRQTFTLSGTAWPTLLRDFQVLHCI